VTDAATLVRSSLHRFTYLYAILIVALPVVLGFVFQNQIYALWVEQFEGPDSTRSSASILSDTLSPCPLERATVAQTSRT
jgi:hypothetical protein